MNSSLTQNELKELSVKKWTAHGRHSNYPECCIKWFCGRWSSATRASNRRYTKILRSLHEREIYLFQPGFIPCPSCVRSRRLVFMHRCDPTCVGKPGARDFSPMFIPRRLI